MMSAFSSISLLLNLRRFTPSAVIAGLVAGHAIPRTGHYPKERSGRATASAVARGQHSLRIRDPSVHRSRRPHRELLR